MKTFAEAERELTRIGVAKASGEALAVSYAECLCKVHGGRPEKYFEFLRTATDDKTLLQMVKPLLLDRAKAWDVLMGIKP